MVTVPVDGGGGGVGLPFCPEAVSLPEESRVRPLALKARVSAASLALTCASVSSCGSLALPCRAARAHGSGLDARSASRAAVGGR